MGKEGRGHENVEVPVERDLVSDLRLLVVDQRQLGRSTSEHLRQWCFIDQFGRPSIIISVDRQRLVLRGSDSTRNLHINPFTTLGACGSTIVNFHTALGAGNLVEQRLVFTRVHD